MTVTNNMYIFGNFYLCKGLLRTIYFLTLIFLLWVKYFEVTEIVFVVRLMVIAFVMVCLWLFVCDDLFVIVCLHVRIRDLYTKYVARAGSISGDSNPPTRFINIFLPKLYSDQESNPIENIF